MFFLTHCLSISCAQWPLSISMFHAIICSSITLFMLHAIICSCITLSVVYIVLVTNPWYSCKKWSLVEEDSLNQPFEFHFVKKLLKNVTSEDILIVVLLYYCCTSFKRCYWCTWPCNCTWKIQCNPSVVSRVNSTHKNII